MDYLLDLLVRGIAGAVIVVIVTYIADKFGPKISGLLSAFPTVSAISLIIMALQHGDAFASKASLSTLFGLTAVYFFTIGFYYGYTHYGDAAKKKTISALIVGFIIYAIFILVYFAVVHEGTIYNIIPLIIGFIIAKFILTGVKVEKSLFEVKRVRGIEHLARAGLGGGFVVIATVMADLFGPLYGGIFSAFPATVAPILIILALTRTEPFIIKVIKYVPSALLAAGAYAIGVWYTYPIHGVLVGTLISYSFYAVAIVLLNILERKIDMKVE